MAKKKKRRKQAGEPVAHGQATHGKPAFPYTNTPAAIRKFLKEIPNRPIPPTVNIGLIKSWNVSHNNNSATIIRVFKSLGLLSDLGKPTDVYKEFMSPNSGPAQLGNRIRQVYSPLFTTLSAPHKEPQVELRRIFNIHTGGSAATIELQIQTFMALCDYATFDDTSVDVPASSASISSNRKDPRSTSGDAHANSQFHIDVHIHLPENKSSREYTAIIEDIGKYIFSRESGDGR